MSFRKRKKKSNNSHFKVIHNNHNPDDNDINSITNTSLSSMSLSFQRNDNSARTKSDQHCNKKTKQQRKKRKMRIKASQRSFQSNQNTNHTTPNEAIKLHSNIGIYTDEYLHSLKLENKSMQMPPHIKQAINDSKNDPILIDSDDGYDDDNNDTIKAKILSSKLQRRTKALANAIETHAQNANAKPMASETEFIQLGKFKSTRDGIEETLNGNTYAMDEDNDEFEVQQMAKSGIALKKKNIIIIDDDNDYKSSQWNVWNENDNSLRLHDVNNMIDNDINGPGNIMVAPISSYEKVEREYFDIDNKLQLNMKETQAMEEKHNFFRRLQNECTAYLNCLFEKEKIIAKYMKIDIYLRQNRCNLLRKNYCFNALESYQEAFYPNDYRKDVEIANAFQQLTDLNISQEKKQETDIWNEQTLELDKRNYLLNKKRRSEYRARNVIKLDLDCFCNQTIENNYFLSHDKLLKEIQTIFEDTRLKYRSFHLLSELLEEWKKKYSTQYKQAFVSISIPKLIAPFVRLELLEWNVLKCKIDIAESAPDDIMSNILIKPQLFISHKWYELISFYGTNDKGEMEENDSDDLIVPTLIASLVITEIINVIKYDWNAYNRQETKQLLLNINCALEHIDGYQQFECKKALLMESLYEKCDEIIDDFMELKCIGDELIRNIFANFKRLPNKPLDCIANSNQIHDIKSNLPNGLMYEYIKKRVFNALKLLECLCVVIVGVNGSFEYIQKITVKIYESVIEGFITYLARCPARNAKNKNDSQMVIVDDLCKIVTKLFEIKDGWKLMQDEDEEEDDEDIQMISQDINFKFAESMLKHIKRSILEINENINGVIKTNLNVTQNLDCLNKTGHLCGSN